MYNFFTQKALFILSYLNMVFYVKEGFFIKIFL